MNNQFLKKEAVGRAKTVTLFPQYQLVESSDPYAVWDMSGQTTTNITGELKPFFIEIKDRNISSTDFDSVFLEFSKYQHLLQISEANAGADIFYLSFFKDNKALIYNLKKLKVSELKLSIQNVNKTTMADSPNVNKVMIELPYHEATIKKLKN
ncbi:hypothetical protein [Mucilaginibacter sp.]|uniref:hypothetical protein n=1 Tax=Mucilaginibacter sp. TaxID=1882438 RepID=UPI003D0FAFFA